MEVEGLSHLTYELEAFIIITSSRDVISIIASSWVTLDLVFQRGRFPRGLLKVNRTGRLKVLIGTDQRQGRNVMA